MSLSYHTLCLLATQWARSNRLRVDTTITTGMAVGVGSVVGLAVAVGVAMNVAVCASSAARSGFVGIAVSVVGASVSIAASVGEANRAR
jgi:hypothetical protein